MSTYIAKWINQKKVKVTYNLYFGMDGVLLIYAH